MIPSEHPTTPTDATGIEVSVLLFSVLRDRVGLPAVRIQLPAGARVSDAIDALCARYESVAAHRSSLRIAVNEEYASSERTLAEGDELALITPVSGG